ncbi:MAG TPA: prolyl oligopeptidase family serine peptidase [Solirubrobacterales bacterium]|jgi:dipeptidyl aminopeptidase/acylaminoacyl peptidase|nr:prolyl oligopeptidase family serine peptidase [Solirubrobacterales bacterium]
MPTVAPYGSWSSPLDAASVASSGRRLAAPTIAADGAVWWAEGRPDEGGRVVLMRRQPGGEPETVTPAGVNVRTRVHEYGGGAWHLAAPDLVLFVDFEDQRLYRQRLGEEPVAISPEPEEPGALRYADMRLAPDGRTIVCVRECDAEPEPVNEIVSLPLDGAEAPQVLASGRDFYASPKISADGAWLAWICWDHPNMPWDGTELWLAPMEDSGEERLIAGGPEESIFQPEWGPDGRLHFASDRDGWWNLYRAREPGTGEVSGEYGAVVQLTEEKADFAHPQWLFGGATYAFLEGGAIACVCCRHGEERLFLLEPEGWEPADLGLPFTSFGYPILSTRGRRVAFAAASPERETAVVIYDAERGETEVVRESSEGPVDPAYVSRPRPIEFETGREGDGDVAYGFYYPPTNPEFEAPEGELPPLIVESHGGPTSHATPALDLEFLYWTSRGIGVVDVNYRGSTGYGREYRNKLRGTWGVVDTEDCVNAALHLAAAGEADRERLAIRGGSAGGYAVLCALTFHDAFATGASYFGVADAETMTGDTHKFESRYLDLLIGPYPEQAEVYRERSPINHVDQLLVPVILFQGLEDKIVPPNQAETMVAALERNGIPHAYLAFEGEQHGFRKAETNIRCLESELYFYGRIMGFEPAGNPEPVEIVGL